ncbi:MAG: hypothetical protein ACQET7_01285 [Thermodesulfobacteriota bacterium]
MTTDAENEATGQIEENPAAGGTEEKGSAFLQRRLLAGGLILLTAVFGVTGYLALIRYAGPGPAAQPETGIVSQGADRNSPHHLVEQDLAPFYIPLPNEGKGLMALVSFSVTWDKTSSKRFQDREIPVRDKIYLRMTELADEGKNMQDMSPTLRMEAQKILEELLQPDVLRVAVTGISID